MKIARPPGGFRISLAPNVEKLVSQACEESESLARYWRDITERLRFVAHIEGVEDARFGAGYRLWASAADVERGLPRVKLVYLVLGDSVRIAVASIDPPDA